MTPRDANIIYTYLGPMHLPDQVEKDIKAAIKIGMEKAARIVEGGNFLHPKAPTAIFAKEAAAAIRRGAWSYGEEEEENHIKNDGYRKTLKTV
jgi:hypothetical protein